MLNSKNRDAKTVVNIYNNLGKLLRTESIINSINEVKFSINTSSLENGMYVMQLINGKTVSTEKFIVLR